jgi:type II secretory pathway pseudopilin PulG
MVPRDRIRAFTLTELLVAVAILIVVIVGTSRIFGTASKVTGVGQAGAAVLQEAAAVERQIRADFERLSREGFFVIRCVAVPNDVNLAAGGALLDPALPADAYVRADQLLFFAHGAQTVQTLGGAAGAERKGQGSVGRIYYGPAFQLPGAEAAVDPGAGYVLAQDPRMQAGDPVLTPWYHGTRNMVRTVFRDDPAGAPADYTTSADGAIDATHPAARQWPLARHAVVLAGDGDYATAYLEGIVGGGIRTAARLDDAVVAGGRVDAAAWGLDDVRLHVLAAGGAGIDPWRTQRDRIADLVVYPRAERVAPGTNRVDQALTNHVIAGACSSFVIDWTYERGVGAATAADGTRFLGFWDPDVFPAADGEQPWFGLDATGERGVESYDQYWTDLSPAARPQTILPVNLEPAVNGLTTPMGDDVAASGAGVVVYEAIFGYNQDRPLDPLTDRPWIADPANRAVAYTPWPSAVRVTAVLHDPETKLETGRRLPVVIDLPDPG